MQGIVLFIMLLLTIYNICDCIYTRMQIYFIDKEMKKLKGRK